MHTLAVKAANKLVCRFDVSLLAAVEAHGRYRNDGPPLFGYACRSEEALLMSPLADVRCSLRTNMF